VVARVLILVATGVIYRYIFTYEHLSCTLFIYLAAIHSASADPVCRRQEYSLFTLAWSVNGSARA